MQQHDDLIAELLDKIETLENTLAEQAEANALAAQTALAVPTSQQSSVGTG